MARKQREEESGGNWMDTYGDMVTLLLTFFVMLYSMSSVEQEKWVELVSAFRVQGGEKVETIVFVQNDEADDTAGSGINLGTHESDDPTEGDIYNSAIDQLYDKIKSYIDENDMTNSILLEKSTGSGTGDGDSDNIAPNISIQFKDNVLFEPDKSIIREDSYPVLQFLGECLAGVKDDISMILIKGHTAISPTSPVDSRLLSSERASTISNFFERNSRMPSTILRPFGMGSDYPIASNDTEEGRALNRRVEIVIINKKSDLGKSSEFLNALGASFDTSSGDITDIVK